jgi:uncharacterized protein YbdZ (MbtH family)
MAARASRWLAAVGLLAVLAAAVVHAQTPAPPPPRPYKPPSDADLQKSEPLGSGWLLHLQGGPAVPSGCGAERTPPLLAGHSELVLPATWHVSHAQLSQHCCCAVCPHSLQHGDPLCKNGGRLHADNYTQSEPERYNNCVQCDCPAGWAGIDCSCKSSLSSQSALRCMDTA